MNANNIPGTRDLLASSRTLLARIRTSVAFAGLGFVVAKFGRTTSTIQEAGYLGIFMVLVGLALIVIGYIQHRSVVMTAKPPNDAPEVPQWPAVTAAATCVLACALLAAYLAATIP